MLKLKILVVDDNRDLADGLGEILEVEEHDVTVVYTGEDALDSYRRHPFDLTFMDIKLPGIDGLEAFREIRKIDGEARVVLMTGFRVDQLMTQAIDDGELRVLRNPFTLEDLASSVREVRSGIALVASDDGELAGRLQSRLGADGKSCLVVESGVSAVEQCLASEHDVLVLDLHLPILDALGVYLELKKHGRNTATVILTGFAQSNAARGDALRSLTVTGCLFKPFDPWMLIEQIDSLLSPSPALRGSFD